MVRATPRVPALLAAVLSVLPLHLAAETEREVNIEKQATTPLAAVRSINLQTYYIGELTGTDETANTLWLRYVEPFSVGETDWILRASLPVNTFPDFGIDGDTSTETGIGDLNAFAAYLFDTPDPEISFGVGPLLVAPTAQEDVLGSGKWQAGLANVLFDARSAQFQWGYLLTWQGSFAGDSDREDTSLGAFQPFGIYQLGGGAYLRSTGVWSYNFKNDGYSIPIGLGIGQVFRLGPAVTNAFIEPQYSIADRGAGQPRWQVFAGLNFQFEK
mgnify:CR=1 FL=1